MPRQSDHVERRAQLAAAALTVAGEGGLDAVTVARVAATAGVSVGLVQHYFPSKQDLMVQAYSEGLDRVVRRVGEVVATKERQNAAIRDMVIAGLSELLPLDDGRRTESRVRAQFHGRAAVEPLLAAEADRTEREVRRQVAQAIDNGRECGETADGADAEQASWSLWCLADGLAATMLIKPDVPAEAVLVEAVTRVFPNPCQKA